MKHILITGTSSGIGRHAAQFFLEQGWKVFGTVRDHNDAGDLRDRFGDRFVSILMDVTDYEQVDTAAKIVASELNGAVLDMLINNAGIATFGPMMHIPMEVFDYQMRVNVHGTIKVTQAFLPLLGARDGFTGHPGKIVHIGSVSGIFATPFLGPYCASKFALEAISDCMRRELSIHDINVVLLQVASVQTPIWDKARKAETYSAGTSFSGFLQQRDEMIERVSKTAMDPSVVTRMLWKIAQGKARKPRYLLTRFNLFYRVFARIPDQWADVLYRRGIRKFQTDPG